MAQVKFFRGLAAAYLATTTHKDAIYFATDTNQIFLTDKTGNEVKYGTDAALAAKLNNAIVSVVWSTPDTLTFASADGKTNIEAKFPTASASNVGLMSEANFLKLQGIAEGAQVNVIENVTIDGVSGTINDKVLAITGFAKSADVYTKADAETMVDGKIGTALASVYEFKGSVANYSALPANAEKGDVYNVETGWDLYPAGTNVAWNGSAWDTLGGVVDFSAVNGRIDSVQGEVDAVEGRMDTAEGNITNLRTDLGNKGDNADKDGSAFARIANLSALVADLTGGSTESVSSQINNAIDALRTELVGDATGEGDSLGELEDLIIAEKQRAEGAESANTTAINNEKTRAEGVEASLKSQIESNDADILALQGRMTDEEGVGAANAAAIAKLNGAATEDGSVAKKVADAVKAEETRATGVESGLASRIQTLENSVGTGGSVANDIAANAAAIDAIKKDYLKAADKTELQGNIDTVSGNLASHVNDKVVHITAEERTAWNAAESNAKAYADGLANNYDAAGAAAAVQSNLDTEIARAKKAEGDNAAAIAAVLGKSDDAATANTVYGAKAYADSAVATALEWGEA